MLYLYNVGCVFRTQIIAISVSDDPKDKAWNLPILIISVLVTYEKFRPTLPTSHRKIERALVFSIIPNDHMVLLSDLGLVKF